MMTEHFGITSNEEICSTVHVFENVINNIISDNWIIWLTEHRVTYQRHFYSIVISFHSYQSLTKIPPLMDIFILFCTHLNTTKTFKILTGGIGEQQMEWIRL